MTYIQTQLHSFIIVPLTSILWDLVHEYLINVHISRRAFPLISTYTHTHTRMYHCSTHLDIIRDLVYEYLINLCISGRVSPWSAHTHTHTHTFIIVSLTLIMSANTHWLLSVFFSFTLCVCLGEYSRDQRHGTGIFTWPDRRQYQGNDSCETMIHVPKPFTLITFCLFFFYFVIAHNIKASEWNNDSCA